jgi:hypothetical protein
VLPGSLSRFTPFVLLSVAASAFVGFHKLAYSFLAARERTLSESESRYLEYAVSVATGRERSPCVIAGSSGRLRPQEHRSGDR